MGLRDEEQLKPLFPVSMQRLDDLWSPDEGQINPSNINGLRFYH
jgi:hypothetical protein